MSLLGRRAVAALAALALLWLPLTSRVAQPTRAEQCPPIATTPQTMRVNGYVSLGASAAPAGTAILAIGPATGALPSGCTIVSQPGSFAMTIYGYDGAIALAQTYPRDSDTLTLYASDAGGTLTLLRASQPVIFRPGTTATVDLCGSCTQNAAEITAATSTPTATPSPTPGASATATPLGTATATPSATVAPTPASVSGSLPPQFAGTPAASLPGNFATGGPDTSAQVAPPPSVSVLAPPPQALVVPGPVQLPPDGSVSVRVVLQGAAPAPNGVAPALQIAAGTLVSDSATGSAFSGVLSPPALDPPAAVSPAAGQALQSGYVPALASGGEATYAVQASGAEVAQFSQPAMLSLPAEPPDGYEPSDLHVVRFDPALPGWRDVPGASSDGSVVVAPVDRTGLYAVVAGDAGGFRRFWVQAFRPATLWSGTDARAIALGVAGQWHHLLVLAPQQGARLFVEDPSTGGVAYVDAVDVGPSGPP